MRGKSTWHEPSPMPSKPTVMSLCRPAPAPASRSPISSRQCCRTDRRSSPPPPKRFRISSPGRISRSSPITSTSHSVSPFSKDDRIISVSSGSTNSRPTTDSISTSTTPNETAVRSTARRSTSCEPSPPHPPQEIAASSKRSTTAPGASSPSDATNAPGRTAAREATTVSLRRPATRPRKPTSSSSICTCTPWRSPSMRCSPNTTSS